MEKAARAISSKFRENPVDLKQTKEAAINRMLDRVRAALAGQHVTEQKMFGGICFLLAGNMLVCSSKRGLLVRVGKDAHAAALERPHARPMEMRGRTMAGYVFVAPAGTAADADLHDWLALALAYVCRLPAKAEGAKDAAGSR